jgi:hypothetical protein
VALGKSVRFYNRSITAPRLLIILIVGQGGAAFVAAGALDRLL